MKTAITLALLGTASILCSPATADTFVESFDRGNEGGWTFGTPGDFIDPVGGNPGAHLHSPFIDTFAPRPRTSPAVESVFTGDFAARNVTSIGVDLVTNSVDFSAAERPCTLMLLNDAGTPFDIIDDWGFYFKGPDIPVPGQGWLSYDFDVDSQAAVAPEGWLPTPPFDNPPSPDMWDDLMQDVDQVMFFYGDPEFFFIFQAWNLGLDNPRITTESSSPADLDGDGTVGPADLALLLGDWGKCEGCPADLDGDLTVGPADLALLLGDWG